MISQILAINASGGYCLSNFYFPPNGSTSKTMKNVFLFHLKSYFRSWDVQIFIFSSSPLFSLVSHCFRGWLKKKSKITCEFALHTYMIELWISPGCSYKFTNIVYVQQEKSQHLLYYNNIRSTQFYKTLQSHMFM